MLMCAPSTSGEPYTARYGETARGPFASRTRVPSWLSLDAPYPVAVVTPVVAWSMPIAPSRRQPEVRSASSAAAMPYQA